MSGQQQAGSTVEGVGVAGLMGGPIAVASPGVAAHEQMYRDAGGDASRLPWEDGQANAMLVSWLNAEAPGLIRPGGRVVVVGCGLGDDVCALVDRGYDVLGFDHAPTAVEWARRRHPSLARHLVQADLLDLPPRLRHRFDLVVEIYTLQSVPPAHRAAAAQGIGTLVSPHGVVLTICRARGEGESLDGVQGPPWPLTAGELTELMAAQGLRPWRALDDFMDDQDPPKHRLRGAFRHA